MNPLPKVELEISFGPLRQPFGSLAFGRLNGPPKIVLDAGGPFAQGLAQFEPASVQFSKPEPLTTLASEKDRVVDHGYSLGRSAQTFQDLGMHITVHRQVVVGSGLLLKREAIVKASCAPIR